MPTLTPKPPKTTHFAKNNKHNNQLPGAFTGTSRTQLSHRRHHHGDAAPLSDAGATLLAPKPGNGTKDAVGLQQVQNHSRHH
eukprot:544268-Ditylum_brightwellii.AAC.1